MGYIVNHPFIAPMDMDMIKLTAQFVARNGQKFLIGLTQRESRNPQFDFLKPTHALLGYFTSLVDAYTKCLMPNKDEVEKLKKCVGTTTELMDKANARFAWDEQEEAQRKNQEEEEKEEKEHMAQIDWHDFIVVETITFTAEDENIPLAAVGRFHWSPEGKPHAVRRGWNNDRRGPHREAEGHRRRRTRGGASKSRERRGREESKRAKRKGKGKG